MLPIIICEDNEAQRNKIKDYVELFIAKENEDLHIELVTDNPYDVLKHIARKHTAIYLLDVDLKSDINGIQLANKIREVDPLGYIIFITTHSELSYMTFKYKVEALDYIIKDDLENVEEKINYCLRMCTKKYYIDTLEEKYLTINEDDRLINIPLKDILFIETSQISHKIIIHEENRQREVYGALRNIQDRLGEDFYRCHRAFFVNLKKISEVDKRNRVIHMCNGEKCLASFRYMGGLLKCL